MPRITLQQQWDSLHERMLAVKKEHLDEFFKANHKPEAVYECNHIGEVSKKEIVSFDIQPIVAGRRVFYPYLTSGTKPKTVDVEQLERFIDCFSIGFSVLIVYSTNCGTTGMYYDRAGREEKHLAFNESDLKTLADERRELYATREGYSPCTYCRKQVPTGSMVPHKIIFQNSRWDIGKGKYVKFVDQKTNMYCSGQCGVSDQMGHEG